ncbi:MAG: site-specific DNA-methyltransferase [Candidatus Pacearchaeota archaeon]
MMKVLKESSNIVGENIENLKRLFPEIVSEGKVDFDKLKLVLGEEVNGKDEKYFFNWSGKKECFKNIQTTSKGTLTPSEKESVNWDSAENLFIEGDNLEVLKLLQKTYFNKIKMIYIDPPYNTGKDFVYKDNFHNNINAYLEQTGQSNGDGVKLTTNPETNGRYHSDWISMIYPRLFIARNFLREDGVIFVSIDDHEVHNLRKIMDEIFGEENFVAQLVWENKEGGGSSDSKFFRLKHEYVLCYSKNIDVCTITGEGQEEDSSYSFEDEFVKERGRYKLIKLNSFSIQYSKSLDYEIKLPNGEKITPHENGKRGCWRWSQDKYAWGVKNKFIEFRENAEGKLWVYTKQYFKVDNNNNPITRQIPYRGVISKFSSTQATKQLEKLMGKKLFDYTKPYDFIEFLITLGSNGEDEIIMDFFAGSGSTGQAVLEINKKQSLNKKFVLIQLPEPTNDTSLARKEGYKTISDIAKERIRRVIKNLGDKKVGFKVFKLQKSNYKIWEKYEGKDEKELKKQLQLFKSPLIEGYKDISVIYECIIKEGYNLNSKIEKTTIKSNSVYKIIDGDLFFYLCLDSDIKDKTIDELKLKKEDMFICLDDSLNDSRKKNLSIQCNLKTI